MSLRTSGKKLIKYSLLTGAVTGTVLSLRGNQYNIDNIGVVRLARAGIAVFRVGFQYKFKLYNSGLPEDSAEYKELKSQTHLIGANLLLDLCKDNKGVYVKVGQHIGSLEYLVPTEYVQTMKVLHSNAPSSPVEHIHQVIKEELGVPALVHIVSWVFPEFKFKWLVEESKKNIARELDFREETENTIRVKKMFSHLPWLKIPDIYPELCSRRLIVMEFVKGGQVNDIGFMADNRIDRFEVSDKLGRLYSEMIFTKGFVHSDPHPGNILVSKSPKGRVNIILLDHGLYQVVSEKVKMNYSQLWLSILNKDEEGMKAHCLQLGVEEMYPLFACMVSGRTWDAIQSGLATTRHDSKEKETFQHDIPLVLPQITEVLASMNRELLLILKTNDLLRGIEHTLKTNDRMSSLLIMSRFCVKCVYTEKKKKPSVLKRWKATAAETWSLFTLNLYYIYLSVKTMSMATLVRALSLELA